MAAVRLLDRAVGLLIEAFGLLSGIVIAFMALAISAEVVVRALGLPAFGWTLEVSEYGLLVVGFLGAPWVLRHSDHIRVDVVLRSVSPRARHWMLLFANALSALVCFVLAWYAASAAFEAFARGSLLFKYLVIPQWWILAILPVGTTLLGLEFVARLARRLAGRPVAQEEEFGEAVL
ncbi:TRAP transporter small permease [Salinarimonas ramus]|uniref:TRAP transporter small permease protein n=1 Tax=Salinarimonas ramus TaxID=690164 RepID=A0A917QCY6_9HYPH|nr:TRAP transporter small permease [Salinarimonas ramus]GGK44062.1 C4-dicarboxylate ABC transporter [Salinarimonas ramus]